MTFIRISLFLAVLFLFSCKANQDQSSESAPIITMEKTRCFGTCPDYTIEIYENGLVKIDARKFLDIEGKFTAKLSKAELDELVSTFENSNFFNFKEEYTSQATDMPTTYVTFNHDGKSKKVKDYHNAPAELKALEKEVGALVDELDWEAE